MKKAFVGRALRTVNPKNIMKLPQNVGKTARTVDLMAKKYTVGDNPKKPGGLHKQQTYRDGSIRPEPVLTSYGDVDKYAVANTGRGVAKAVQGVAKPVQGVVNIATKQRVRRRR